MSIDYDVTLAHLAERREFWRTEARAADAMEEKEDYIRAAVMAQTYSDAIEALEELEFGERQHNELQSRSQE